MPKVSIIVPVYNVQSRLSICIESILSQTYSDFEVLLIDDGSTDNSGVICDNFVSKDSRIKSYHKLNGGASSARNYGLEKACGDFICFVDADDTISRDFLEVMLLADDEDLSVCSLSYEGNKDFILSIKPITCFMNDLGGDLVYLLLHMAVCSPCCKVLRKSIIEDHKVRFNEAVQSGEDVLFIYDYISSGLKKIRTEPLALYHYYITDNSLSSRIVPVETTMYVVETITKKVKEVENVYLIKCDDVRNEMLCTQLNNLLRGIIYEPILKNKYLYVKYLLNNRHFKALLLDRDYIITRKGNTLVKRMFLWCALNLYRIICPGS